MEVKNQWQQALWYVINWDRWFSLKDVINDSMFYKFQTRLGEIEAKHGKLTSRNKVKYINRFGRKSDYMIYNKSVSNEKLLEIFKTY